MPKSVSTRSTDQGRRAFEDELARLALALGQHSVADEAVADADGDADLADLGGERGDGGEHRFRRLFAAHDLEQAHHVGGREEVHAEHVLGPLGLRRDLVDVQVAGVRGEDRAGLGDAVEPLEDRLFQVHVLVHGLDHEVGLGERAEIERRGQAAHPRLDLVHRHAALPGRGLVVLAHDRDAALERFLRGLDHGDGNAGGEEIHRDAAAHGAGADDADPRDRLCRHVRADVGDLGCGALGEEHMPLRLRLGRAEQRHEHFALFLHAFVERQVDGVLDRLDRFQPRLETTEFARVRLADRFKNRRLAARRRELLVAVAHLFQRRLVGDQLLGEGDRAVPELALLGERVDHAPVLRFVGAERRSGQNDLERRLDADEAGQALGAAGAGDQAELDLRQAAFGRGDGDPVMRGQRDLEAAAERRAVQGGDHRLSGGLNPVEHVGEIGRRWRLAEFGDVGPGDEGAAGADQDRRLDRGVGLGLFDAELEPLADVS